MTRKEDLIVLIRKQEQVTLGLLGVIDVIKKFNMEDSLSEIIKQDDTISKCEEDYDRFQNLVLEVINDDEFNFHEERMVEFEKLIVVLVSPAKSTQVVPLFFCH